MKISRTQYLVISNFHEIDEKMGWINVEAKSIVIVANYLIRDCLLNSCCNHQINPLVDISSDHTLKTTAEEIFSS